MAEVVLDAVGKVYADGTRAVDDLNLRIADGEFLVLVGPSGCGKTTALWMVAGLEDISEGEVRIGDRVVNDLPARDRDIAMVFQSYALYPHLDVFDNIAFGLRLRRLPSPEIEHRVAAAAGTLGLREHLRRRPRALSGGQRQRVAMGRAIVRRPSAFLMDEPLSNLDAKLRVRMRAEIARNSRRFGVTTLYVTHDQTEAMTLGDRVAVLKRGVLQQVAPPQELYDRPANMFVAGFIGSPPMNLVHGRFTERGTDLVLELGEQTLPILPPITAARIGPYLDRPVAVGIRPEDLADASLGRGRQVAVVRGTVDLTEVLGSDLIVHLTVPARSVVTDDVLELARDAGVDPLATGDDRTGLVARFSPRSRVGVGETVDVAVDTGRLHVFDLDTGLSIW
ncbi:ABC transporter ATP-binding protein [Virgisporangium aurantiacum]|uniref:ABC transporter ATP-binding protein n=1 Tax=Virgisporangium aurantiacum TaxID=175570 RepID=UPI001EF1B245|nr:ATP-binding cassette domain-containing protein [Virgisporangium aurantiacum]